LTPRKPSGEPAGYAARPFRALALAGLFGASLLAGPPARAQARTPAPTPSPTPSPAPAPDSVFGARETSPMSGALGAAPTVRLAAEGEKTATGPLPKLLQIVVKGGKTTAPETIGFYLGLKAGEPYNDELAKRNFVKLWDSGLFEDVTLEKEVRPDGVVLTATVVERPTVADLEFRGNKKLTTSQLKDKLKEGKAEIRIGAPVSLRDVAKAKGVLLEAYKAEGFRSASVEAQLETVSPSQRRVVFNVDEGDKIKIESIRFTGNTVFGQQRLRNAMKKTKTAHWWRFFDSKSTYNQASYDEDVENLRKVYQDTGYKDVVVKDPILDVFVVNPKEKRPDKIKRRARLTIPIVEGERWYFGKLDVEGSTVIRPEILEKFFPYRRGKPLSRAVLADGMKSIEAIYRGRGYIYVFMNPEFTEKPNHVVDVSVKIAEGDQYRLGRVEFQGNKTTRDKVLRRELQIFEGDIMDMETFKKSIQKVSQLGYFKVEEDPDFKVNNDKKTVDITIKGTDTNRNEVQFGAGYSQLDGLFGQFQFNTRNFLGRGDTLGLQFQRGNRSNFFDVSFSEPWFLDQRMSVGGSIFNRTLNYSDVAGGLDQSSKGVNLSLGLGLGLWDVVSLFYGFTDTNSKYQVYPPPPPPGSGAVPIAFTNYVGSTSAVTPGYRYDSRNDPFDPTRGMRYGVSVSVAGGALGGDFSFVKPAANFTGYLPATKFSNFAVNLEFGALIPYDSQAQRDAGRTELPIFERYRIGGDRSVRGFKYGAIFPLDKENKAFFDQNGALLGGNRFLVFNLEYVYQLAGPLKLALFFDAGNAWLEGQSVNPFQLRSSAGLELRIFLPIFQAPLRFIYGINLDPKTIRDQTGAPLPNGQESRTDFQFSIGTTF
jgi:outer membrane protein insertion porin family